MRGPHPDPDGDPDAAALADLPPAHGLALRLRAAGADHAAIAAELGIAPEAVAPLLVVAEAKLRHRRERPL